MIAERYGIGNSTVSDIRRNREKIEKFGRDVTEMGMKKKVKTMKLGADKNMEEALYVWFKQKRMEEVAVSGPMLREKAIVLN